MRAPSWLSIAAVLVVVLAVVVWIDVVDGAAGWAAVHGVLLGMWVFILVEEWGKR